jgi:hypothetical protein
MGESVDVTSLMGAVLTEFIVRSLHAGFSLPHAVLHVLGSPVDE